MISRVWIGLAACEVVITSMFVIFQTDLVPQLPDAVKSESTSAVLWLVGIGLAFALAIIKFVIVPVTTAVASNTASLVTLTAKIDRDIHEAEEARRHLHALRTAYNNTQTLNLNLIEYLEVCLKKRLTDERNMIHKANESFDTSQKDNK